MGILHSSLFVLHSTHVLEGAEPEAIELVDKAIQELKTRGNLAILSESEQAALKAHDTERTVMKNDE